MTNIDLVQKSTTRPKYLFKWVEKLVLISKDDRPQKNPIHVGDDNRDNLLASNRASAFFLVERFRR